MAILFALKPVSEGGWIGAWAPGIGDPTVGGWLTTALYFAACGYIAYVLRRRLGDAKRSEVTTWRILFFALLALGINKQLDLQTAFTEIGRQLAHRQGWYEERGAVQQWFVRILAVLAMLTGTCILYVARRVPSPTRMGLFGAVVLIGFVLARASSFHHMDHLINTAFLGVRANWILEMGGISLVLFAAIWRSRWPRRPRVRR